MRALVLVSLLVVGCVPTVAPAAQHTLPDPLVQTELPPEPPDVPPADRWTAPVEDVEVAPGDVRSGVLFSDAMALRAGQLRVEYDRVRGLYLIDLRTWGRERQVYERVLTLADEEIATWRSRAERSWWEINGDEVMLVVGLVLGGGIAAAVGGIFADLSD